MLHTTNIHWRLYVYKALCLANNVVLAAGHPFPGPFKFCKAINAAVIRPLSPCFESSVGNPTLTEGLFTANPAWTSLTSACREEKNRPVSRPLDKENKVPYVKINILRGWARARNLNRLSVGSIYRPVAVPRSSRVQSRFKSQFRGKTPDRGSIQTPTIVLAHVRRFARNRSWRGLAFGRETGRGGNISFTVDRLLLQRERGRNDGTSLSRTIQILKRDGGSGESSGFIALGITSWERYGHGRVVKSLPCLHIGDQLLKGRQSVSEHRI